MARPLSLPLFPEEPPPRRPETPAVRLRQVPKQLWLAVHFPRLALETLRIRPGSRETMAVLDGQGQKIRIHDCTEGAARMGVRPGQSLNSTLAMVGDLQTVQRDAAAERGALIKLAESGHQFTPTVSLEAPASLLLEVEGSAHLFGGTTGILGRVRDAYAAQGFAASVALAPTPIATLWLAQSGLEVSITASEQLRSVLGKLPLTALPWPAATQEAFTRLGVTYVADVFRLPRDGLAKRFGNDFLQMLDRALGKLPDPRSSWHAPKRCKFSRELPGELIQVDHMQPYVDDLVEDLARELLSHDAAVDRVKLVFKHWKQPPTTVLVGSAIPYRQAARWRELIHMRLASLRLVAPAHDILLLSGRFLPYAALNHDLLGGREALHDSVQRLADTIRARVGRDAVFGMTLTADGRPEHAARRAEPGTAASDVELPEGRPIHLLPMPLSLSCSDGKPRHRGATLSVMDGPERIEGGWWSREAWVRDYYEVVSTRGERLWIFREGKQWFLHGLYS